MVVSSGASVSNMTNKVLPRLNTAAATGRSLAAAGQVVPAIRGGRVGWLPVVTPTVGDELARLTTTMPPVVRVLCPDTQPWQITQAVVTSFTDDAVRVRLAGVTVPQIGGSSRRPTEVVARRLAPALAAEDPHVVTSGTAEEDALARWSGELARWTRSVDGRSPLAQLDLAVRVVEPRDLDVAAPAASALADRDPEDLPWLVEVLLAPHDDPSLQVSATDLGDPTVAALLGRSVAEALGAAFEQAPQVRGYVVDDQGQLRKHVAIYVDGQRITDRARMSDPVGERSEIWVLQALSGG